MASVQPHGLPSLHRYPAAAHSGVSAYAVQADAIVVEFRDGSLYLYNHDCPGRRHVERMKALADDGAGLATYITRRVGKRFAARLR
jgi:hypothetical protein